MLPVQRPRQPLGYAIEAPRRLLVEELRDFDFRVTPSANLVAEARVGAHDDLVTALGLATLTDHSAGSPQYAATGAPAPHPGLGPVQSSDLWASLGVDKPLPR